MPFTIKGLKKGPSTLALAMTLLGVSARAGCRERLSARRDDPIHAGLDLDVPDAELGMAVQEHR